MNTNLKEKIQELINNLSVKSYNKARVNNAIDKIVESSGGSTSDDGVPIFYVSDEVNTLAFKLMQGKPKVSELGYLESVICIGYYPDTNIRILSVAPNEFSYVCSHLIEGLSTAYANYYTDYVDAFSQLKVGESVSINKSDLEFYAIYNYRYYELNGNKNFNLQDVFHDETLAKMTISYWSNNNTYLGHVVRIDHANLNIYVSINNELWKYSYTLNANRFYTNITFVEVVQS